MLLSTRANRPVFVVDIDETLLDTAPRKIAILYDLFGMEVTYEEVSADYYLSNYLHTQKQVEDFFREFHSGKYLYLDAAINCAPQALQCLVVKLTIVYLTGRHAEGIYPWMAQKSATLHSFRRFGFPLPDNQNTFLVMKPWFSGFESMEKQAVEDHRHKTEVISQLVAQHYVLAGIGDSFSDLCVYSEYGVFPICLKRPHFADFRNRLGEIGIQPFIADDWLAAENRVLGLLAQVDP